MAGALHPRGSAGPGTRATGAFRSRGRVASEACGSGRPDRTRRPQAPTFRGRRAALARSVRSPRCSRSLGSDSRSPDSRSPDSRTLSSRSSGRAGRPPRRHGLGLRRFPGRCCAGTSRHPAFAGRRRAAGRVRRALRRTRRGSRARGGAAIPLGAIVSRRAQGREGGPGFASLLGVRRAVGRGRTAGRRLRRRDRCRCRRRGVHRHVGAARGGAGRCRGNGRALAAVDRRRGPASATHG